MSIMGELKAVQSATDLRINAFNKKGKKLDSFTFIEGDDFELDFKTNKALKRAKRGKVRLQVEDLNGDESNFTLESGEQADFEPDSFIKTFKIKRKKPFLNKDLRLPYTVIENQGSEEQGNNPEPKPNPDPKPTPDDDNSDAGDDPSPSDNEPQGPNNLRLTDRTNIFTSTLAQEILANNTRDTIGNPLSERQDILKADAGSLGQNDAIRDDHSGDSDELHLSTNSSQSTSLQEALSSMQALEGIESMTVKMNNDDGGNFVNDEVWFDRVKGMESLVVEGTSKVDIVLRDHLDAGIRMFDFRNLTFEDNSQQGVVFNNDAGAQNNKVSNAEHANTTDTIVFYGSKGYDSVEATGGTMVAKLGSGDDEIVGGFNTKLDVTGGRGYDYIGLVQNNEQDIVRFRNITNGSDYEEITQFETALFRQPGQYDILSFEDDTYTNYEEGRNVKFVTAESASLQTGAQLKNSILVDEINNIETINTKTNKGTLAIDADDGYILYSPDGNFQDSYEEIGQVNNGDILGLTAANIQIH
ncbi:hypothetical protein KR100_05580 [Synechococcus sp. KORDI-100]|nr:hypothetical protein KR100_05580 [Synechococcus sp. KORDI-100]